MTMVSMASFALNQRQQDNDNGNNGDGKSWAYEAAQLTCSLKTFRIDILLKLACSKEKLQISNFWVSILFFVVKNQLNLRKIIYVCTYVENIKLGEQLSCL